ncbi:hypothetical protein BRAO375_830014 [Bradyrhizobium sp. ORS 375]|nr:hypothetical protein BRAO375_830014 [Bradyrhizobium sp. ORS 375]
MQQGRRGAARPRCHGRLAPCRRHDQGAGRARILTFGRPNSKYRLPAAGPRHADIRRGFSLPEQASPWFPAHLSDKRVGSGRLFGFPSQLFKRPITDADP